jgi:hypothetical protein
MIGCSFVTDLLGSRDAQQAETPTMCRNKSLDGGIFSLIQTFRDRDQEICRPCDVSPLRECQMEHEAGLTAGTVGTDARPWLI